MTPTVALVRSDSPDPDPGGWINWYPLHVFPQTVCGPAEVTGRTCLLVERLAERERRREGEPEGEQSLNGTGIQVFTLDPSFLKSFYVCLPHRSLTIGDGILTLCVRARVCVIFFNF